MKIRWSASARQDRTDIYQYIARENPSAADRIDQQLEAAADSLAELPHHGRPGRVPGSRELLAHRHYFLVYDLDADAETIAVLAVIHTSQQWPPDQ